MRTVILLLIAAGAVCPALAQRTDFVGERAYDHLRVLAGDIGPRPMGSPAEQKALRYAVGKFREYGCDETTIMPMLVANGVNTNSGIAVGIKKGKSGRMILIGGHIDSAGPDVPGANDDGSGAACVIELARVICARQNYSTVAFCCWGGEEEGLRGSRYFVDHFPQIDSIDLMLQLDMADGAGPLLIWPGGPYHIMAPRWLTRAAFELGMDSLAYRDLVYYTHAMTLNYAGAGNSGSDHEAFLEKGIPAIDFTSDITFPIHTPLDNLRNFTPSGLYRSGDVALKLFERFDKGTPEKKIEKYYLLQFGSTPLIIMHTALWISIAISVAMGSLAMLTAYRRRIRLDKQTRVRWSGTKIVLYLIAILCFAFFSENVVGYIRGIRFPWVNNFTGFVALALLGGFLGLWLVLRLASRWKITPDPFSLYLRAFAILLLYTAGFALSGPELALYPASALFLLGAAMIVRKPTLKFILAALSPLMILHLAFMEDLGILLRGLAVFEEDTFLLTGSVHAILIFIFALLALPFAYGFAAVYRDSAAELRWLGRFETLRGLGYTILAFAVLGGYLAMRPVYDRLWQKEVHVEETWTVGSDSGSVAVRSSEYLTGLTIRYANRDTILRERITSYHPPSPAPPGVPWLSIRRNDEPLHDSANADSMMMLRRTLHLESSLRPYIVEVEYHGPGLLGTESPWSEGARGRRLSEGDHARDFTWYSFPDTVLDIPVTIRFRKGSTVIETVKVTYDTLACPLRVSGLFSVPRYSTVVTAYDSLNAQNPHLASLP